MLSNEGKACDAVIQVLELRTNERRTDLARPEQTGNGPPVELILKLGTQHYAIEHTMIEAFTGQIATAEEFGRFINPVTEALSGTLPGPAVYHLYFPLNARLNASAQELEQKRDDLIAWIREHAQRLHEENPERPTRERTPRGFEQRYLATPPGFPYEIMLVREAHWSLSPRHDGVLLAARIGPQDVEELRVARLHRAFDRKCPKLQHSKEEGARTVLILEDCDMILSNHALISDALAGLLDRQRDLPDEIYLVETAVEPWVVRCMKCDSVLEPDGERTEFASAELTDLTGPGSG